MKNIASALVKAQKAFGPALKTNTNPHFKSKYADLSACVEAVIDALNANGIFLMQATHEHESGITVETIFIHESGEQVSAGKLHVPASKHDAQGFGSAATYARRYSLMAACGIAPEDDDGNAASRKSPVAASFRSSPTMGAIEQLQEEDPDAVLYIHTLASVVQRKVAAGEVAEAFQAIEKEKFGDPHKPALWSLLPSQVRTALTKHRERLVKEQSQPAKEAA